MPMGLYPKGFSAVFPWHGLIGECYMPCPFEFAHQGLTCSKELLFSQAMMTHQSEIEALTEGRGK